MHCVECTTNVRTVTEIAADDFHTCRTICSPDRGVQAINDYAGLVLVQEQRTIGITLDHDTKHCDGRALLPRRDACQVRSRLLSCELRCPILAKEAPDLAEALHVH